MTTASCREIPLVEALRDGRLAPQDRASTERHLSTCAECRAYARELELIGDALRAPSKPEASELEHQRARRALLSKAMTPERKVTGSAWRAVAFAAVMLLVAVGSGWGFSRLDRGAPERALAALHVHLPVYAPIPRETTIHASRGARFEHATDAGLETLALKSGELDVRVRPLGKAERFVVRTDDAEIEVRGTAFHVAAEDGKIRGVTVVEGSVEVRYAGFTAIIPSGGSWRANGDSAPPSASVTPPASSAASLAAGAPSTPSVTASSPHAAIVAAAEPLAPRSAHALTKKDPTPPEPVAAPEPAPTKEASPASRAFADAMDALARGDNELAADRFGSFSAKYAGDARSDEADYLRAIALQRAGHDGDARAASRRYLSSRPDGAHRADAKVISGP